MRETAPAVRSQNTALRDLLPFYSVGHFAFATVLVAVIYLVVSRLDSPTAAAVVALGSFLGIAAVGSMSKPAWMLVTPDLIAQLEAFLLEQGYQYERGGDWVPPLPIWLRWSYNKVRIHKEDAAALVTGPATVLRGLATELERHG